MKSTVILHLCILISLAFVVRCDDDDEEVEDDFSINQQQEYDPPTKEYSTDPKIISRNVKCLGKKSKIKLVNLNVFLYICRLILIVCQATILEMQNAIKKVDPRKKVDVSGFRMDPNGFTETKSVQYSKSETYLTELMETICKNCL